jgi:phosphomannomutase
LEYLNGFLSVLQEKKGEKIHKVVIGRDTRNTGTVIEEMIAQGCAAAGVDAVRLGVATTPTVEMMVPYLNADGGIIVTASHNPMEWNALKFLDSEGIFLDQEDINSLFEKVDQKSFAWASHTEFGTSCIDHTGDDIHIQEIMKLPYINLEQIREAGLSVAYDGVNGAGYSIVPKLLQTFGCTAHNIHITPDGTFPRGAEPTPDSLQDLSRTVTTHGCHIGFATDPDGDRCAIVDETGFAIGEEYTLALATRFLLQKKKGPVTVNLSTSRMNQDIAKEFGVPFYQSKVGEINVTCDMKDNQSVIGGEGNGGVILPDLHYGRDGVLAVALVLQAMAESGKSVSELVAEIPAYVMIKEKYSLGQEGVQGLEALWGVLKETFAEASLNDADGLRFDWDQKWVHVRASNTEPVVRVIAEAPTQEEARTLCVSVKRML